MIAQFALRLLCGITLMWSLMPRQQVTTGFFRIQMLVALGLSVLALLTAEMLIRPGGELAGMLSLFLTRVLCGCLVAAAFMGSVGWTLGKRKFGNRVIVVMTTVSLVTLLATSRLPADSASTAMLRAISEVSTSAVLGGAVTAMLLGHWYLTAPTMSITPLSRLNLLFLLALLLRLAVSGWAVASGLDALSSTTHWMWLTLRWAAGIVGPLILCVMVWRILKYRNTQSATGVLFAAVILTFIGELSATLLDRELLMPF